MNYQKLKSAEVPLNVGLVGMAERGLTNLDIVKKILVIIESFFYDSERSPHGAAT